MSEGGGSSWHLFRILKCHGPRNRLYKLQEFPGVEAIEISENFVEVLYCGNPGYFSKLVKDHFQGEILVKRV